MTSHPKAANALPIDPGPLQTSSSRGIPFHRFSFFVLVGFFVFFFVGEGFCSFRGLRGLKFSGSSDRGTDR